MTGSAPPPGIHLPQPLRGVYHGHHQTNGAAPPSRREVSAMVTTRPAGQTATSLGSTSLLPPWASHPRPMYIYHAAIDRIRPQHGTPIPLDPPTFLASSPHDLALAHVRLLRRHPPDPPTAWDSYPFGSANLFDIHIHPAVLGTTSHGLASAHVELSRHAAVIHWIRPQHGTPIPLDPPTFLHSTSTPLTHPPRSPTLSVRRRGARGERSSSTKPPDPDHQALKLGGWSSPDWGP